MKYELVTTFPEKYRFGFDLVNTAEEHLPSGVELIVYYEGVNVPEDFSKVKFRKWHSLQAKTFVQKSKLFQESKIPSGIKINSHEYLRNQMFMWHASRFCWKMFAMMDHMKGETARHVMWIDADVEFRKKTPIKWFDSLTKEGAYGSFLDRPKRYTETGFLWFDTHHEYHEKFWQDMSALYNDLEIFNLPNGWMDCQAYDHCRKSAMKKGVEFFDLVLPEKQNIPGEVWDRSYLEPFTIHFKSERKPK